MNERERENKRFGIKKNEREEKEVEKVRGYIGIANKEMGSAGERTCPPCCNEKGGRNVCIKGDRGTAECVHLFSTFPNDR